jgi:hypothetical protein
MGGKQDPSAMPRTTSSRGSQSFHRLTRGVPDGAVIFSAFSEEWKTSKEILVSTPQRKASLSYEVNSS